VVKAVAVATVLPICRAAVFIVRQVSGAGAVEALSLHCRELVGTDLVGAVAGHIDTCSIYLYWDVDHRVCLNALS
jgi:hypothetical protein